MTTKYVIEPASPADVNEMHDIALRGFLRDKHTQFKSSYRGWSGDMDGFKQGLESWTNRKERIAALKAVDTSSGRIAGYVFWVYKGLDNEKWAEEWQGTKTEFEGKAPTKSTDDYSVQQRDWAIEMSSNAKESLQKLNDITSGNLNDHMEKFAPDGTRCMFIMTISVDPDYQGCGIGTKLIEWGKKVIDREGIFGWVHGSEKGAPMFESRGFKEVDRLTVDLDEYDVEKKAGHQWGEYTFKYMQYHAQDAA